MEWELLSSTPNPWGQVPLSGGRDVGEAIERWMAKVEAAAAVRTCTSTRHHYVPQSYMKAWSEDDRRVRVLDLRRGTDKQIGLRHVCVREHFYRVTDSEGHQHQQVEKMLSVIDEETARLLAILRTWQEGDDLYFDDFMSLCLVATIQRNRTPHARRFIHESSAWSHERLRQDTHQFSNDYFVSQMFEVRHQAADQLSTRQLELWDDPAGRFITSDQPIIMSPLQGQPPSMLSSQYIWWPISPTRLVTFNLRPAPDKILLRRASKAEVMRVRQAVIRTAEEVLIVSRDERNVPSGKVLPRRQQLQVDCQVVDAERHKCRLSYGWGYGTGVIDHVCKTMCWQRALEARGDTAGSAFPRVTQ